MNVETTIVFTDNTVETIIVNIEAFTAKPLTTLIYLKKVKEIYITKVDKDQANP